MRINNNQNERVKGKGKRGKAVNVATGNVNAFSEVLKKEEIAFTDLEVELSEMRDEIDTAGDALEKDPSMSNFTHFRDLIRALTKRVSKDAYRLRTLGMGSRKHQIIATIDKELNMLYRLIMHEQKNRIDVTNKVIRLKGLVVDALS